ncbi:MULTISPECIES: restriction endonuclease subunit S [unclassified Crossiella]|uniref:restriction endonuclease subunit S n=1 Tax=unclassified Crossiella TaxID=2620835 RepID=UPI00200036DC|nr:MULTISPECIES: restriction endonuclease subunit S [unclassified Crossiella]MCK2237405.1 restriction endonuclease subunit S [Crossiella sp. S99.2]MCK2251060.1 restriction endonuclease subunit S [Crossiella sp. S99.1]
MRLDIQRTPMMPATTYRLAGVLNAGKGLISKGELDGGDTEYAAMNVLRVNQVVMRKLTAWEGPITVVSAEFDRFVVSNEFPTFTLGPELVPDWMRHVCRSPRLWAEMKNRVSGTVQRRKRLNPEQLLQIQFPIPPRDVQVRIVEVLDAVDDQIIALDSEANAAEAAAGAIAESILDHYARVRIGNYLDRIEGGRSPRAVDTPPAENEKGVLKVSAVAAFHFAADESKKLAPGTEMSESAEVRAGDVLVTRASGTINRVGAACRVPSDVRGGLYLSDKTLRMVPADGIDPDFLVIAMALSTVRRQIAMAASGSASMKNISQSKIAELKVPRPELAEQRKVASMILSMYSFGAVSRAEANRLRQVRAALLSGLLDRTIDIESAELEV